MSLYDTLYDLRWHSHGKVGDWAFILPWAVLALRRLVSYARNPSLLLSLDKLSPPFWSHG